ncbi:MAG: tRNA lysidine(34) synthetase TilS [Desulfuromonadaceae bacterium GWC2_58_13]|nr:MAG: tRNA lysidine(34) synthetase TilS [Desulfuromonadaceae bacterium GWC2_58_13]
MDREFIRVVRENRLLAAGDRVLVAVSGGPDSVALLGLLCRNATALEIVVTVAHLDHRIRQESEADARFVDRLCADLGVGLTVGAADVPTLAHADGEGLEAAGRRARRHFLLETADAQNCAVIALGHHRGDQAETFLQRLLRGTGASGLASMAMRNDRFIRPLLPFSRNRLLEFLDEAGLPYVEDESNRDPRFTRNRIRHHLLPLMRSFNPRIDEHLTALSRRFAVEEDFWRQQENRTLAEMARPDGDGLTLDRSKLLDIHPALRARVLRRALEQVRGDLLEIDSDHLMAIDSLLCGARPQGELHLPRAWVGRRYERLRLCSATPVTPEPFLINIAGPGRFYLPSGGCLTVSREQQRGQGGAGVVEFDGDAIGFPLLVRSFQPGDRFRPAGGSGEKKLKDFFIDNRIELEERRCLPLLVGPEILWLVGLRRCEGYQPLAGCRRIVRIVYTDLYI